MTGRPWRTAHASVAGTSHVRTGAPCQDVGSCDVVAAADGSDVLVAVVSDGAGTGSRSEAGAALAVGLFLRDFGGAARAEAGVGGIDRGFALRWLASAREGIAALAAEEGHEVGDYACTLLGAVIGRAAAAYLQIGDGAIVVSTEEPGEYGWVFWPQHGEYANSTCFLTQDGAAEVMLFDAGGPAVDEVALFSDGIERLVLDHAARTVHSPAFRPIFGWLVGTEPGTRAEPSAALAAFLGSDRVNARTDDDKTLVMATRAPAPVAP